MNIAIAIPARYESTRFPGKPLAMLGGKTMLNRVVDIARTVATQHEGVSYFVATDDQRIVDHCIEIDAPWFMTPTSCPTGSDRVLAAIQQLEEWPDFVINIQGDAPFTPIGVVDALIAAFKHNPRAEVVTPVHQLSWDDLDRLRAAKLDTPFSGTTAVVGKDNQALWFSKSIIPAIRKEENLRTICDFSPVHQHMGLYGYRVDILKKFCTLPIGIYEEMEGLEQLRMLENGIQIQAVHVDIQAGTIQSGIDTPEDLKRGEAFLAHMAQNNDALV